MKKLLAPVIALTLLAPGPASAAFNDARLSSGVVLSVGGISLSVLSDTASIESLTVDSSTFSFRLLSDSTLTVKSNDGYSFTHDAPAYVSVTRYCVSGYSWIGFDLRPGAGASTTVTVTPSTTACSPSSSSNSGGGGGSSGGGGGSTAAVAATPTTQNPSALSAEQRAALIVSLTEQLQKLMAKLAAMIESPSTVFARDLKLGFTGEDVKALQIYLNAHGYTVASAGPGSPGNETTRFGTATRAALVKLQKAAGISPALGYFGPQTRSYILANP